MAPAWSGVLSSGLRLPIPAGISCGLRWWKPLQSPDCALCEIARHNNPRYVETLLDESVIDVEQRDTWRAARGLCSWHASMAVKTPQAAGSLAILYHDVLQHDLSQLGPAVARQRQRQRQSRRAPFCPAAAQLAAGLARGAGLSGLPHLVRPGTSLWAGAAERVAGAGAVGSVRAIGRPVLAARAAPGGRAAGACEFAGVSEGAACLPRASCSTTWNPSFGSSTTGSLTSRTAAKPMPGVAR